MENVQVLQLLVASLVLVLACGAPQLHGGYSFSSFTGPVSGAVRAVPVARGHAAALHPQQYAAAPTNHHAASLDYVAKPDYSFAYGVDDPTTGNSQKHRETRDGDVVQGEYTVLEADGSVRTVTYTADATNGFQATVHQSAPNPANRPPAPSPHAYYDY